MITADELEALKVELARLPAVIADARRIAREERELRGISVRAMARQMRVPPTTLARFEKGDGTPHMDTLIAVLTWITTLPTTPRSPHDRVHLPRRRDAVPGDVS